MLLMKSLIMYNLGESWPLNIVITVSKGGTMTDDLLKEYMEKVYNKRPGAIFNVPNLLIMDSATCHNADVAKRSSKRCEVCAC